MSITTLLINHIIPFTLKNGVGDGADMYKLKIEVAEADWAGGVESAKEILRQYATDQGQKVLDFTTSGPWVKEGRSRGVVSAIVCYYGKAQLIL